MRLGIAGWALTQIEKKLDTEFPILVEVLALALDFAIYAIAIDKIASLMGAA